MQLIPCPNCGTRDEIEFHYGGQAHVPYPEEPAALTDTEWAAYLFFRDNPKGPFAERWFHGAGCRRWFNAIRDTASYQFLAVYRPGEPRPDLAALQPLAALPGTAALLGGALPGTAAPTGGTR